MNVPKLRFKEFTDEWCNKKFDDLIDIKSNTYNPIKSNINYRCIELEHINQNSGTINGFINSNEQKSNKNFFKKGEVLFSKLRPYLRKYWLAEFNGVCSSEIWVAKSKNDKLINNKFIFDIFQSNYFLQLCNLSTGSKMPRADWTFIREQSIPIPLLNEQLKIANFLNLLDKKIDLQNKKIEALKLFKSSQICTTLNKIEHKNLFLKDLGYFISGNHIGKDKITDNGTPVILYGDLYTKYEEEINDVNQYVKGNKKYIKSEKGDLIFPTSTTVDAISLISPSIINISDVVYGSDLIIFKVNKAIVNPKFLSYQINHLKKKEFSKKAQGSTIIHIHADDLLNSTVEIPIMKYQNTISNFGSAVNKKIELEKNKLDKLKLLKTGLMQIMFI